MYVVCVCLCVCVSMRIHIHRYAFVYRPDVDFTCLPELFSTLHIDVVNIIDSNFSVLGSVLV